MKRAALLFSSLLLAGLCLTLAHSPASGGDKKIEMVPIKLKDLIDKQIAGQKGKIVILDLWGNFCIPCKEEFPNLVRMHHTYGDKGVVCMSLSLDYNEKHKKAALEFLKKQKAVIANYWLEEGIDAAQKQWNFTAVPVCAVYGRDGKIVRIFNNDDDSKKAFTYKTDVEPLVQKLLAK